MKRPIKFKAIDLKTKEWRFGNYVFTERCTASILDTSFGVRKEYPVICNTVCQFTGLIDKNGKDIYEGDIVRRCHDFIIGDKNITLIEDGKSKYITDAFIEYVNGTFRLNKIGDGSKLYYGALNFTQQCYNNEIEVIGNIHDKNTTSEI